MFIMYIFFSEITYTDQDLVRPKNRKTFINLCVYIERQMRSLIKKYWLLLNEIAFKAANSSNM